MSYRVLVVVIAVVFLLVAPVAPTVTQPLTFSGVKFPLPIAASLTALGVTTPTPIQKAAIGPLTSGLSAVLHAETGSGKTLAYLLPLMKRIYGGESSSIPLQALIVVPTKELAIQVAADVFSLLHAVPQDKQTENLVHLCIANKPGGLDGVISPIVIGTPQKLLSALRMSGLDTLDALRVSYCVVDEADRCLAVRGRYAPTADDTSDAIREENPTGLLISALAKTQPADGGMQLVASSATVGRPLRRELFRLLQGGDGYGELTVIRPEDDAGGVRKESKGLQAGSTRQVTIPRSIRHVAFMCEREEAPTINSLSDSDLNVKLSIAKDLWIKSDARKACLFVPTADDVQSVLGILRFWGISEAKNLQSLLGVTGKSTKDPDDETRILSRRERRALEFGPPTGNSRKNNGVTSPNVEDNLRSLSSPSDLSTREMVERAILNKVGSSANLKYEKSAFSAREFFVLSTNGARGLHIKDVDIVYVLCAPKTMDEYLHMAGRTGREGKTGRVVTLCSLEELKRLQSWQTALDITYDIKYSL